MAMQLFLRWRRLQRVGKVLVLALTTCFASYFFFTFSKLSAKILDDGSVADTTLAIKHVTTQNQLNVHIWRGLCGGSVANVRKSLFFPRYPDEQKFVSDFQIEDDGVDYGEKIFGFVHPPRDGSYRFAIASDDTSELWLSASEDPDKKQLIASVFIENATAWTDKDVLDKYPEQTSNFAVKLRGGRKYYVEVLHKQGTGNGFVQVFWTSPDNNADFKLITSKYVSPYFHETSSTAKKVAIHNVFSARYTHEFEQKSNRTSREFFKFYSLPFISKVNYLLPCDYKTSFVSKDHVYRYEGLKMVAESNVYPADDTLMAGDKGIVWTWANRAADKQIIHSVVDKIISSLRLKTAE